MCPHLTELKMDRCQINPKDIYGVVVSPRHRFQWEMKISKWCSSSTSSRWWCRSASLSRDRCLSTTAWSHLHNRIAQGEHRWRSISVCQVSQKYMLLVGKFSSKILLLLYYYTQIKSMFLSYSLMSCSPSVSYLQPPSSEQYQITQSPSPCNPQQLQQQYSGLICCCVLCIRRSNITLNANGNGYVCRSSTSWPWGNGHAAQCP